MRVLLVEDDDSIAEPLADGLKRYGIEVLRVATGMAALTAPRAEMVLLDLGLPDIDGIEVCRRIRRVDDVPLIMLTARGDEADRVLGLELGADDYMAKPFSVRELVARMHAVGRRVRVPRPQSRGEQVLGPLVIDHRAKEIRLRGTLIPFSPKEYDLLVHLAADPGAVVDRRAILEAVWEPNFFGRGKTLDFHVAAVRRKLGAPGWIETRRGVGFRLVVQPA
ncbi:response regulator transcription factor [Actinoplanes derwentensis]|uniref:DNA-binding response regulator, OmpR family, contains REC and winged-helix (WHTH) domain n=1 Tax=Actinoplanes derwentensis TaxID=113562 RepID=A0A1H2BAI2_9ACTN|nr:response regulator transcription factor [Actinoplanes derwentensis]GID86479.1 DNA-binding response regulator [Actinoplanes derwentensis]SDT54899.1 DNA-binding response regulator, OmpR family, contains REC and winged-helix (wHTH) domain [Actinoplanes derwentensis]